MSLIWALRKTNNLFNLWHWPLMYIRWRLVSFMKSQADCLCPFTSNPARFTSWYLRVREAELKWMCNRPVHSLAIPYLVELSHNRYRSILISLPDSWERSITIDDISASSNHHRITSKLLPPCGRPTLIAMISWIATSTQGHSIGWGNSFTNCVRLEIRTFQKINNLFVFSVQ